MRFFICFVWVPVTYRFQNPGYFRQELPTFTFNTNGRHTRWFATSFAPVIILLTTSWERYIPKIIWSICIKFSVLFMHHNYSMIVNFELMMSLPYWDFRIKRILQVQFVHAFPPKLTVKLSGIVNECLMILTST